MKWLRTALLSALALAVCLPLLYGLRLAQYVHEERALPAPVRLEVPAGAYRVTTDAGAGEIDLDDVIDDDDAQASIDVYAGAGEIEIVGR